MLNFDFYNPTRILFGQGRIADLDKVVPAQARVLILYGGGSVKRIKPCKARGIPNDDGGELPPRRIRQHLLKPGAARLISAAAFAAILIYAAVDDRPAIGPAVFDNRLALLPD